MSLRWRGPHFDVVGADDDLEELLDVTGVDEDLDELLDVAGVDEDLDELLDLRAAAMPALVRSMSTSRSNSATDPSTFR